MLTPLHEEALKISISIRYLNDGKGINTEDLEKLDWLKNISIMGIQMYLKEAMRRRYIREKRVGDKWLYVANKQLVEKQQEIYFP